MAQPTQNSLIHILLLWTTILSLVQAAFIILFFTAGQRDLSQNNSAVALQSQANNTPSPPTSGHESPLGLMLTYKATQETGTDAFKWVAKNPIKSLASEDGKVLQIYKDGYYFLNLQVTLKKSPTCPCNESICTVSVTSSDTVVLQGWINKNTCSTGSLGKVEVLAAKDTLKFTINLPKPEINETESLTYLNIVYMNKALID